MRPVRVGSRVGMIRSRAGLLAGAGALAMLVTVPGCGAISGAQEVSSRTQLINNLADRLSTVNSLTYTAVYQIPHGRTGTIAQSQDPPRAAYTYPGGKVILNQRYTAECATASGTTSGRMRCTLTPAPSPSSQPTTTLLALVGDRGLIAPGTVIGLLAAAALDSTTVVDQHDTTIAGEHATCVDISGVANAPASAFSLCVTMDGLLGSFTGTVDGSRIEIMLDHFSRSVAADAFALPDGATVVDKRPH